MNSSRSSSGTQTSIVFTCNIRHIDKYKSLRIGIKYEPQTVTEFTNNVLNAIQMTYPEITSIDIGIFNSDKRKDIIDNNIDDYKTILISVLSQMLDLMKIQ